MNLNNLLKVLADGEFHSGEHLGESLGVSRTAVWKKLKKLEDIGLHLESVTGKGYRLSGGLDLLSEEAVSNTLVPDAAALLSELSLEGIVDSTNSVAMAKAVQGGSSGYVVAAEQQTAGRGRRGRVWQSPFAKNLYFSVNWNFSGGAAALEGLSLVVALALIRSLNSLGLSGLTVKWPNDLLCDGKKLAGILLEMTGDAAGSCAVVIGIGVNVFLEDHVKKQIDQSAIGLGELGVQASRSELLALLLNELLPILNTYESTGFAAFVDEWHRYDAFIDQQVCLTHGEQLIVGRSQGVAADGALVIVVDGVSRSYKGGELSLRLRDGS